MDPSASCTSMDNIQPSEVSIELAQDFASLGQVDFGGESQKLDVAVEDMLAKLEEFGSLMDMMSECSGAALSEMVPRVFSARQQLQQLFQRVDALETFVTKASQQLSTLEEQMDRAERDLAAPGSLTQAFSSLFQPRRADGVQEVPSFTAPEIYHSEDFFHPRKEPVGRPE